jgi:hypothetical protein
VYRTHTALSPDLFGNAPHLIFGSRQHGHVRPLARERQSHSATDAAPASSNQRNFICESLHE